MTPLQKYLDEVEERLKRATPAKWEHRYENAGHGVFFGALNSQRIAVNIGGRGNFGKEEEGANAALIASCPTDLAKLLAIVKVQREALEKLRGINMPSASTGSYSTGSYSTGSYSTADITLPADEALAQAEKIAKGEG